MIIQIKKSPLKEKRYRVILDNNEHYDFGYKEGKTYIDHHNKEYRDAYIKRHMANSTEKLLILKLIPSPSLFSRYLLWGPHTDLYENAKYLNNLWKNKEKMK